MEGGENSARDLADAIVPGGESNDQDGMDEEFGV